MYAVFKSGGKQYFVKKDQVLKIEKVPGKKGDNLSFSNVLAISNGPNNIIGNPLVKGASIEATIINHRFGINSETTLTLDDIASMFNISRERVRQIQNNALKKLRKQLKEDFLMRIHANLIRRYILAKI